MASSATEYPVKTRVLATIPKSRDLETHVRLVEIDGMTSVALSDFIPSLSEYGRSYYLPVDESSLRLVAQALGGITRSTRVD